jgi:hypothetical protein
MSDNHQIALDPYELEYDLAQLEKELADVEKMFSERPITSDFLPVKANLQIQIDQKLTELGRPTRYYAKSELRAILESDDSWPTIPRDSYPEAELEARASLYSAPPAIRAPPKIVPLLAAASGYQVASGLTSGLGPVAYRVPKKTTIGGCETLTIDGMIQRLQELRVTQGGDAPVWRDITDGSGFVMVTQPIRAVEGDLGSDRGVIIV